MSRIAVSANDCIDSIAYARGLLWKTVWDHPENQELKQLRKDPNVLHEGDEVFVPEIELRKDDAATEQRHRYRRRGVPAKIKIRVLIDDQPVANTECTLVVDGVSREMRTDRDGFVGVAVMPDARSGQLRLRRGNRTTIYPLSFGRLSPISTDQGIRDRLKGLGFDVSTDTGFNEAVRKFAKLHDLNMDAGVDDSFRSKLREVFGQ